ncbi:MAG: hypothetical protein KAI14_00100, partial [Dehalococcoidales bacterium]|nr:hypothetical protein [Dehalococcoidales bacterium]
DWEPFKDPCDCPITQSAPEVAPASIAAPVSIVGFVAAGPGTTVELWTTDTTPVLVAAAIVDSTGSYYFVDMEAGTYTVECLGASSAISPSDGPVVIINFL